ncbi:MAG: hypothetical protein EOP53_11890, partial [Sphingobacteriales bacterium]
MVKNTTATVEVLVNNEQASKSVKAMENDVRRLRQEWRKTDEGTEEYINSFKKFSDAEERLKRVKNEAKAMTQAFAPGSIQALDAEVKKLESDLNKLPRSAKDFTEKTKELQRVKKEFAALRHEIDGTGGVFKSITAELGKVGVLAAGYLGFQAIT